VQVFSIIDVLLAGLNRYAVMCTVYNQLIKADSIFRV